MYIVKANLENLGRPFSQFVVHDLKSAKSYYNRYKKARFQEAFDREHIQPTRASHDQNFLCVNPT